MTIYTHLRMTEGLRPDFRPQHSPADQEPPHHVSPTQPVRWVAALCSEADPKPHPLASVEPILRRQRDGQETRLDMTQDPAFPGVSITPTEMQLEQGTYDVEMHCVSQVVTDPRPAGCVFAQN